MPRLLYIFIVAAILLPAAARGNFSQEKILFLENNGQLRYSDGSLCSDIAYYARTSQGEIYFAPGRISYVFRRNIPFAEKKNFSENILSPKNSTGQKYFFDSSEKKLSYRLDVELINAKSDTKIFTEDEARTKYRFYSGKEEYSARSFRKILYRNVYENIDLVFYTDGMRLKYDYVVHPGGKISDIQMKYVGAEGKILSDGSLKIAHPLGEMTEGKPFSYVKNSSGNSFLSAEKKTSPLGSEYLFANNTLRFRIDKHDRNSTVVIDPEIAWSSYFGAEDAPGSAETPTSMALDSAGNIFLVGSLGSGKIIPNKPGMIQQEFSGAALDAFVLKFTNDGQLDWFTYLGAIDSAGARNINSATGVVTDGVNCYLTGYTTSARFPTTAGAFMEKYQGSKPNFFEPEAGDAFLCRISSDGKLIWSTYLGGSDGEISTDLCIDRNKNLIAIGRTRSEDFPVTSPPDRKYDGYISKFDTNGARIWSRYYLACDKVCADSRNNFYTITRDGRAGRTQILLTKFDENGQLPITNFISGLKKKPEWYTDSIYVAGETEGLAIAVDHDDNVIVAGKTNCDSTFAILNGLQETYGGGEFDAFVVKIAFDVPQYLYGTYLGVQYEDAIKAVCVDKQNSIYISGTTFSDPRNPSDWQDKLRNPLDNNAEELEVFVTKISTNGALEWSTLWGGSSSDFNIGIAVNNDNEVVIAGTTSSPDFPVKKAYQEKRTGDSTSPFDMFISKFRCITPLDFRISAADTIYLCENSDTVLSAPAHFVNYTWSNGKDTKEILINQDGDFEVEAVNKLGCVGRSNRVHVKIIPTLAVNSTFGDGILDAYTNFLSCDSIVLRNRSEVPFIIRKEDFRLSQNTEFSFPLTQFPIVIPPFSNKKILACLFSTTAAEFRDTITLYPDGHCLAVIPVAGLTADPELFGSTSCAADIRLRLEMDAQQIAVSAAYPNPAGEKISVPVYYSQEKNSFIECELLNAFGEKIASAESFEENSFAKLREKIFAIKVSHLSYGIYFCRVSDGKNIFTQPIIISR